MRDNPKQPSSPSKVIVAAEVEAARALQAERRQHGRYAVSVALEAVEVQSKTRFSGRISDLSMSGCYVDTISTLPAGVTLKIRLRNENKFFETRAKVITSSAGMGMSVAFTDTEPQQLKILEGWIRELSGEELPSEPDLPEIRSGESEEQGSVSARSDVLAELIIELMRAGVLSDAKGKALLQKASRH